MAPRSSDLAFFTIFALLNLALEVYLASSYGIKEGETPYLLAISFIILIGILSFGYIAMDYLESRIIPKYRLEIPLLAAIVTIVVQAFMFYWIFSLSLTNPIFIGRTLDAYSFAQVMSIFVPSLIVMYVSKE
ncbi:MAG: hypothetical protein ACP6IP_05760 [Candidatus Njordarchaeia archaeon]